METSSALFELAAVSLACRDQDTLLKTLAARAAAAVDARAVLVWMVDSEAEETQLTCRARWTESGERLNLAQENIGNGLLAAVLESAEPRRLASREIANEDLRIWTDQRVLA